jgi:hypothetical protein
LRIPYICLCLPPTLQSGRSSKGVSVLGMPCPTVIDDGLGEDF